MNSKGSPSDVIALGYRWKPGTELSSEEPLGRDEEEVA
jgi:hypothetical protein